MATRGLPMISVLTAVLIQVEAAQALPLGSIRLEVTGLSPQSGTLIVTLHQNQESLDGKTRPAHMKRAGIKDERMRIGFDGLEPGYYAIAVFQDLNGNGRLDRTEEGVPTEPAGFSGQASGRNGGPEFRDAAIRIDRPDIPYRIHLVKPNAAR